MSSRKLDRFRRNFANEWRVRKYQPWNRIRSACLAVSARFYISERPGLKIDDAAMLAEDREQRRTILYAPPTLRYIDDSDDSTDDL